MPTALPALSRFAQPSRTGIARLAGMLRLLRRWCGRYRQRCDLGELDDRLLDDIGVTREQADEERGKPFWR